MKHLMESHGDQNMGCQTTNKYFKDFEIFAFSKPLLSLELLTVGGPYSILNVINVNISSLREDVHI